MAYMQIFLLENVMQKLLNFFQQKYLWIRSGTNILRHVHNTG